MAAPEEQTGLNASPIDLTTLQNVKDWVRLTSANDDELIQSCITAVSAYILWRTGQGDQSGDLSQSPLAQVCNFTDIYDGSGTYRLFLHNRPIVNVSAVVVDGFSVPASSGSAVAGFVIDGTRKSIALRPGLGSSNFGWTNWQAGPYRAYTRWPRFTEGIQNVSVQYSAGYAQTPFDLELAAKRIVALNYKRRDWTGELSRSMGIGAGSVRLSATEIDPQDEGIILAYTRTL